MNTAQFTPAGTDTAEDLGRIHLIGVGGVGMIGQARLFLTRGLGDGEPPTALALVAAVPPDTFRQREEGSAVVSLSLGVPADLHATAPWLLGGAKTLSYAINMAAQRPRYLATPGSGWEMLMQFGNTLLQDRIVFASGWMNYQMPIKDVIDEMRALPLKEEVREKWLYKNAARLLRLD